jgi:predicted metal-dependent phosphoesterase TrpH
MEPYRIMTICKKMGIDTISITDHDSIKGALNAKKYENDFGIEVLIGEEKKTDCGDIIGLNITEEIKSYNWIEVVEEIKDQGGICVFPHPFRGHQNIDEIAQRVDFIEIFNSRGNAQSNKQALELALKFNKPHVVGSDAHLYSELGNSIMLFDDFFSNTENIVTCYSNKKQKVESYLIKDIKLKKYHKIPQHLMRLFF